MVLLLNVLAHWHPVVGYLVIGAVLAGLLFDAETASNSDYILMLLIWPLFLCILVGAIIRELL